MALKVVFLLLIITIITCLMPNNNAARATRELLPIPIEPGFDLARRLEESGGIVECWNALMELKSCSNEIIIFFLNGQADIGPGCCEAIGIITLHCWSSMLTSLGFTVEEGNMLIGFCNKAPVASPPLAADMPMKSLSPSAAVNV